MTGTAIIAAMPPEKSRAPHPRRVLVLAARVGNHEPQRAFRQNLTDGTVRAAWLASK